jgi:hypothetical protein
VSADIGPGEAGSLVARRLPPVAELAVVSMALVIAGGIYLVAHLPERAPLAPAVGLLVTAGVVLVADAALVSSLRPFAWRVFFQVAGWVLVAYVVIGGMLEFIFVFDDTRGALLVVLTLSLLVFALDIPILLGFSVARYQDPARPVIEGG